MGGGAGVSTWALRLAGDRKRLALWCTIQGVETVFLERTISASVLAAVLGETRASSVCIPKGGIDEGATEIDLHQLAQVGGGLRLRMQERRNGTVLSGLFQSLRRKATYLTSNLTKAATTVNCGSTTGLPTAGTIYLGGETITYTGVTATSFTGCTRGKFGSRAQAHKGAASDGTGIYTVPPAFLGRRISLWGSFLDDAGNATAARTTQLGTFTIEDNPTVSDSTWELQAGPLIDEYMGRQCYVGQGDVKASVLYFDQAVSTSEYLAVVEEPTKFVDSATAGDPTPTYAAVKFTDGRTLFGKVGIVSGDIVPLTMAFNSYVGKSDLVVHGVEVVGWAIDTVRHFAVITGGLLADLLQSVVGDDANGSHDTLPGVDRTTMAGDGWRFGAAIHSSDTTVAELIFSSGDRWAYVLDETVTAGKVMAEWCRMLDRFAYVTPAGVLKTARTANTTGASVLTINSSTMASDDPPRVYVDEASIYPTVRVLANYNPLTRDFDFDETTVDGELLQRYPQRDDALEVQLKGIEVDVGHAPRWGFTRPRRYTIAEIEALAQRWQLSGGRGRLMATVTCSTASLICALNDLVTIGFSASDFAGGDITGRTARVVGRRPRYDDGTVELTLHIMEPVYLFAPSAVVTALTTVSIANDTLTLSATSPDASDADPSDDFPAGCQVRLWDMSATVAPFSQVLTVAEVLSGRRLRFTAGVTGAIEANRDWLTWNTLGTNVGLSGSVEEADFLYMMVDSGVAAAGPTRRWQ